MKKVLPGFLTVAAETNITWSAAFLDFLEEQGNLSRENKAVREAVQEEVSKIRQAQRFSSQPCRCAQRILCRTLEVWKHEVPLWKPPGRHYQIAGCLCQGHSCCRRVYLYDPEDDWWYCLQDDGTYPLAFGFPCK